MIRMQGIGLFSGRSLETTESIWELGDANTVFEIYVFFFSLYKRLELGNTRDLEIGKEVITTVIKYSKEFKWCKRSRNWLGKER